MKKVNTMFLRQMKYFIAVAECNSFTEAAEAYYESEEDRRAFAE